MADEIQTTARWRWWRKRKPLSDMTDAELGAVTRRCLGVIRDGKDRDGIKKLAAISAALFLVDQAVGSNAKSLDMRLGGVTIAGHDVGEWDISARAADETDKDDAPVMLGGWLKPGKADEAMACFDRLTTLVLRVKDETHA